MNQQDFERIFRSQIINHFNNPNNLLERLFENNYMFIPDDFWEPVKVTLSNKIIDSMKKINEKDECIICSEDKNVFKEIPCCKNKMCNECTIKWFNESVCCPYCKKDIREVDLKKEEY